MKSLADLLASHQPAMDKDRLPPGDSPPGLTGTSRFTGYVGRVNWCGRKGEWLKGRGFYDGCPNEAETDQVLCPKCLLKKAQR